MRRLLHRFGVALAALLFSTVAFAQIVTVPPVRLPGGGIVPATGVICLNLDGSSCTFGGGSGGASNATVFTNCANTVTAAASVPLGVNTKNALCVVFTDPTTGLPLDPNAALPAGTNVIGKFGIDQTTPGTTDSVTVKLLATKDANGAWVIPESNAPTVTKTTLTANTSTPICPTATHPVTTEIYLNTAPANVGLGLKGQSLSTDVWGTGSTAADFVLTAAGQYYSAPVAYNTAITARSTGTPNITCVQTLRQ